MKFKEFMTGVGYLPATVFSGLFNLVFGSTQKSQQGEPAFDSQDNPVANPGLFGLILDFSKYLARSLADFIANHKKAIAVAFWSSLALAGAAALTVFLWPAALTAVTTFSIYGVSIASVVGANTVFQIGAVAALAFTATSVATYFTAAVINTISAIVGYVQNPEDPNAHSAHNADDETDDEDLGNSAKIVRDNLGSAPRDFSAGNDPALNNPPIFGQPVFTSQGLPKAPNEELFPDAEQRQPNTGTGR